MDVKVGQMSAATVDKKAAELRRRAEALRENLRRRKASGRTSLTNDTAPDAATRDSETRG